MVGLDTVVAVGDGDRVHVLLPGGELVESIDLGGAFFTNAAIGTRTHRVVMLTGQFNF